MKLTFGKFNGWEVEDLARTSAGRRYLSWAADSLRSPQWREACTKALAAADVRYLDANVNLSARALMVDDPGFSDIYEAEQAVRADLDQEARWVAEQAARAAAENAVYDEFAGQLVAIGATIADARKAVELVLRQYSDPEDAPASRFSSPARRAVIVAIAGRIQRENLREWEGL